jgi:hypothetical protein
VLTIVDQRPGRQPRFFDHILETECHMNVIDLGAGGTVKPFTKVAIA